MKEIFIKYFSTQPVSNKCCRDDNLWPGTYLYLSWPHFPSTFHGNKQQYHIYWVQDWRAVHMVNTGEHSDLWPLRHLRCFLVSGQFGRAHQCRLVNGHTELRQQCNWRLVVYCQCWFHNQNMGHKSSKVFKKEALILEKRSCSEDETVKLWNLNKTQQPSTKGENFK